MRNFNKDECVAVTIATSYAAAIGAVCLGLFPDAHKEYIVPQRPRAPVPVLVMPDTPPEKSAYSKRKAF